MLTKIALPNALPRILAGMRLGLTVALILSVVGEMLTGQQGLCLRILFAGAVLLGVVGLLSNTMLDLAQRRLLRWMPSNA